MTVFVFFTAAVAGAVIEHDAEVAGVVLPRLGFAIAVRGARTVIFFVWLTVIIISARVAALTVVIVVAAAFGRVRVVRDACIADIARTCHRFTLACTAARRQAAARCFAHSPRTASIALGAVVVRLAAAVTAISVLNAEVPALVRTL